MFAAVPGLADLVRFSEVLWPRTGGMLRAKGRTAKSQEEPRPRLEHLLHGQRRSQRTLTKCQQSHD
jgi:hypothetical protein